MAVADPRDAIRAAIEVLPTRMATDTAVAVDGPYVEVEVLGHAALMFTADEARALARELLIAADKVEGRG